MRPAVAVSVFLAVLTIADIASGQDAAPDSPIVSSAMSPLEGSWTLVAAEVRRADGTVARDYGEAPAGRLIVDAAGRYSLQIFDSGRPAFASGDKARGTDGEYRGAVMGASTHFGTVEVDEAAHALTFRIEQASFPNWNGAVQRRQYELENGVLSYRVPPRPNGDVPVTVWRRTRP